MVFLSQQSKQKWSKIKIGIFAAMFLLQYFCLLDICVPNHTLKLKAPDQPQSAGRTVFWHMILHSYFCNVLCKFFIKIESNCFSKTFSEIESTWPLNSSKEEIFCHVIVKNYLPNISWEFLIKTESSLRYEIKEQAPQLTLLFHGRTLRSIHLRCGIREIS